MGDVNLEESDYLAHSETCHHQQRNTGHHREPPFPQDCRSWPSLKQIQQYEGKFSYSTVCQNPLSGLTSVSANPTQRGNILVLKIADIPISVLGNRTELRMSLRPPPSPTRWAHGSSSLR
ncbi:PREDICTED: uncharacterized protein LOC109171150 [Ipomoea nil]|uniref:uncharacterized protein LOC109171150 n=1 Tax=Ipomoea nil TaxID=35883 RepID=UPI000900A172|nr:PREDICTED: uncharacterized protein LOC109171150 [Ipomoea nil]